MATTNERAVIDAKEVLEAILFQINTLEYLQARMEGGECRDVVSAKIESLKNSHFQLSGSKRHDFKSLLQS